MIEVESNCSERASNLPLSLKQCQNARNLPADDYINKEWPGNFFFGRTSEGLSNSHKLLRSVHVSLTAA